MKIKLYLSILCLILTSNVNGSAFSHLEHLSQRIACPLLITGQRAATQLFRPTIHIFAPTRTFPTIPHEPNHELAPDEIRDLITKVQNDTQKWKKAKTTKEQKRVLSEEEIERISEQVRQDNKEWGNSACWWASQGYKRPDNDNRRRMGLAPIYGGST